MGITIRKSLSIKFPNVEDKFKKHVIRGIFDGDGSVYVNRTSTNYKGIRKTYTYINASITTGSEKMGIKLKEIFNANGIGATIIKDSRGKSVWYVKIYSRENIRKLFDYLYNDSEVFLKRKKDIFNKMI